MNRSHLSAMLEDFNSDDAEVCLRGSGAHHRPQLLDLLAKCLGQLAAIPPETLPAWNEALDNHRLRWESTGFELWVVTLFTGAPPSDAVKHWLNSLAAAVARHPRRVCHRDFHLNNLFFLPGGEVGMIDIQDILVGPDTYDVASLLGERALPELVPEEERERVLESWPRQNLAPPGWHRRWRETSVQRGLKVLATFSRLVRSGKTQYARWIPPLAERLEPLTAACDAPRELRRILLNWSASGGAHVR